MGLAPDNHVHLLVVPLKSRLLAKALGRVHSRHARPINAPRSWTGHLWASQFYSMPPDAPHLWRAMRYVELNPVRARLVERAEQ